MTKRAPKQPKKCPRLVSPFSGGGRRKKRAEMGSESLAQEGPLHANPNCWWEAGIQAGRSLKTPENSSRSKAGPEVGSGVFRESRPKVGQK